MLTEEFLQIFRQVRAPLLADIDRNLPRAILDGESLDALKQRRRALLDFPDSIAKEMDRASLVKAWDASLPADALPFWFRDPEEAARLDPPKDGDVIVDCSAVPEERELTDEQKASAAELAKLDPAAIIATRQAKAIEEAKRPKPRMVRKEVVDRRGRKRTIDVVVIDEPPAAPE